MNKKIFAVVLSLVMLFALAIPAFAADINVTVATDKTTLKRGDTVTVTISLGSAYTAPSAGVDFVGAWDSAVFDPVVLDAVGQQAAWAPVGMLETVEFDKGVAGFAAMSAVEMNGTLLTFEMKIKDDAPFGTYEINPVVTPDRGVPANFVNTPATVTITHDCVPATEYTKDADAHWYDCTVAGCNVAPTKVPHTWTGCEETCPDCGQTRVVTHTFDKTASDANEHWNECACGKKDDASVAAHDFKEVVDAKFLAAEANCQTPAKYYKSCTCGAKSTETFENGAVNPDVHANTVVKDAKPADCKTEGYTGDTYCVDEDKKVADGKKIEMTAHTFGEWVVVKEASTSEEGSKERTCTVCKTEKETAKIDKLPAAPSVPTGDSFNAVLWTVLSFASVAVLAAVVYFKKREGSRA